MLPRINVIHGQHADYLLSVNDTIISPTIYNSGVWEPHLLTLSQLLLEQVENAWVIDIGANLGAFTVPIAKLIAPLGGVVTSFEPQRIVYYQLCGNIFLNRLDNCYAYQYALGDADTTIEIPEIDFNQASNVGAYSLNQEYMKIESIQLAEKKHTVQQIRLDNIPYPRENIKVALIKIDTEGLELKVLQNGLNFLKQHDFPPILFEAWSTDYYQAEKKELFDFLEHLDYKILKIGDMDYIAQHPYNPSYFEKISQSETQVFYQLKQR